jgi:DNA (cytosine-5)-methyltransferase 1
MNKLRVLDLFSGIGGFSLGLERTGGFETVAFCEIEDFSRRVLAKHWPEVPCYDDIIALTGSRLAADGIAIDVITGGFPCQAHSHAARGNNTARDFWPEMARMVSEVKPRFVIAENVQRKPIARAAEFFVELGMSCDVVCIPADVIGADHRRSRWWAVAHTHKDGEFSRALDAEASKLPQIRGGVWGAANYRNAIRISDGVSPKLGEVRAFGNAVIPQIPELIGHAILSSLHWKPGLDNDRRSCIV